MPSPLPAPPSTRFVPAAEQVMGRQGVTVVLQRQPNLCRWAVHAAALDGATHIVVGPSDGEDQNPSNTVLGAQIAAAVAGLGAEGMPVYADAWSTAQILQAKTRLTVTGLAPHPEAVAAARKALGQAEGRLLSGLVLSADASRNRAGKVAGCGWVLAYRNGADPLVGSVAKAKVTSIRAAELAAIRCGLADTLRHHPALAQGRGSVTVKTDSRPALSLLERAAAGEDLSGEDSASAAEARGVLAALHGVRHRFVWVRGHSGDPLNELADRLAVMARRNAELGVDADTSARMLTALRRDAPALIAA